MVTKLKKLKWTLEAVILVIGLLGAPAIPAVLIWLFLNPLTFWEKLATLVLDAFVFPGGTNCRNCHSRLKRLVTSKSN